MNEKIAGRTARAFLLVAALLVGLACTSVLEKCSGPSVIAEALNQEIWQTENVEGEGGFVGLNKTLEEELPFDFLPDEFYEEVLDTTGFGVSWNEQYQTVGLFKNGDVEQVMNAFREELVSKGWQESGSSQIESDSLGMADVAEEDSGSSEGVNLVDKDDVSSQARQYTFLKDVGHYRWLFVSGTQVGECATVVIQYE